MTSQYWRIGWRTLKTLLAVYLCLQIDHFRPGGIPFYSAIAAIYCMQGSPQSSWQGAKHRELATVVGGLWGMAFIFVEHQYLKNWSLEYREIALTLMLIPIIQFSIWIKQTKATFLMCVVFLSVTLSHGYDEAPILFAFNRILDTSIGIITALIVNYLLPSSQVKSEE
ncbi:FUSC family protein [Ignavigranum ruoffiae]|uniref:FUSC family protein n=1 Tax=Ignavigranum ruoffiae TaxID=89093 RepID=UPI0024ADE2B6|nr:aromatic acid exporter family protein [Ignavigranum ruoffiae]